MKPCFTVTTVLMIHCDQTSAIYCICIVITENKFFIIHCTCFMRSDWSNADNSAIC